MALFIRYSLGPGGVDRLLLSFVLSFFILSCLSVIWLSCQMSVLVPPRPPPTSATTTTNNNNKKNESDTYPFCAEMLYGARQQCGSSFPKGDVLGSVEELRVYRHVCVRLVRVFLHI